jgi:predicted nucleic acid-binding protein
LKIAVLDTDVLIDFLRGSQSAIEFVSALNDSICVSALTVAELYVGVRDGKERKQLDALVAATEVLPITAQISQRGGLLRRDFKASHGVGFVDALIAATVIEHSAVLYTHNVKHYPMLNKKQLAQPYKK